MNASHLHLIFTHWPIVGLGFAIIVTIYAIIRKNPETWRLSIWTYIITGLLAIPAYLTGEGAEEMLLTYPGYSEGVVEPHEQVALFFFIGMMIITAASLVAFYLSGSNEKRLKKANIFLLVAALLLGILAYQTGSTGGKLRHPEITNGSYQGK
jgi:uncharacterized membrane protein